MTEWMKFENMRLVEYCPKGDIYKFRLRKKVNGRNVYRTFDLPNLPRKELMREVAQRREAFENEICNPSFFIGSLMTFSSYYENVYLRNPRYGKLKPRTREEYERLYKKHIKDGIGNIRLYDLRAPHLREFYNRMYERGVGTSTIQHIHRHVKSVLNDAFYDDIILKNPALGRDMTPEHVKGELKALTAPEIVRVLDATSAETPYWRAMIHVLALTGCRRGEAAALTWDDIDFDDDIIRINKSATRVKGRGVVVSEPKTKSSNRYVFMIGRLRTVLLEHRNEFGWSEYLFPMAHGSVSPLDPDSITTYVRCLGRELGIDGLTPHTFRRSISSVMRRSGIDVSEAQKVLGHSDVRTTQTYYIFLNRDDCRHAMESFGRALDEVIGSGT